LSHGYTDSSTAGTPSNGKSDDWVRQPDAGSVTSPATDQGSDGAGVLGDARSGLEEYRASVGRGDDQPGPGVPDRTSGESEGALEALLVQLEQRQWSGPLPPPATLYQYELVQPGLAERIIAMAETTATGEIKIRDKLATAEIDQARTGQALAFLLTIAALGAAIYFFAVHDLVAGGALLSFPVIMLIRSFLTGIRSGVQHQDESSDEKSASADSTPRGA